MSAAPTAAAAAATDADPVSTAQARLDDLGQLFYSSVGEVWQHAAPVSVAAPPQPVAARENAAANAALAQRWAGQLGSAARELQGAVDALSSAASPAGDGGAGEQMLLGEEQRSIAEGDKLLVTVESAEQWLSELQRTIRVVNARVVAAKTARGAGEGEVDGED
jgi:hypothetical protein